MSTIYIYNLFNSSGVSFYIAKEACVVCFSIKPLVSLYVRETFIFDNILTQLAQAWSINTVYFLAFIIGDSLIDYCCKKLRAAI